MDDFITYYEKNENGQNYILAKSIKDGSIYRFEPLPGKLPQEIINNISQESKNRNRVRLFSRDGLGIIPVLGPFRYKNQLWFGWRSERGSFWLDWQRISSFELLAKSMFSLINCYLLYHGNQLVVTRPLWDRIRTEPNGGILMPDPRLLSWLGNNRLFEKTIHLDRCYAPEIYSGASESKQTDIFYLGLLIYQHFIGGFPFCLKNNWPTDAILTGKIIPPYYFWPEISPGIGKILMAMLNPDPAMRPEITEVADFWRKTCFERSVYATPQERQKQLRLKDKQVYRQNRGKHQLAIGILGISIILILLGSFSSNRMLKKQSVPPDKAVAKIYQSLVQTQSGSSLPQHTRQYFNDFIQARDNRFRAVEELLKRPLAKVEQIRTIEETRGKAIVEISLGWWRRTNQGWQKHSSKEWLELRLKHGNWKVYQRKIVNDKSEQL